MIGDQWPVISEKVSGVSYRRSDVKQGVLITDH